MPCALHLELLAGTADFIEAAPPITDGQVAAWIKLEHRFVALDKEKDIQNRWISYYGNRILQLPAPPRDEKVFQDIYSNEATIALIEYGFDTVTETADGLKEASRYQGRGDADQEEIDEVEAAIEEQIACLNTYRRVCNSHIGTLATLDGYGIEERYWASTTIEKVLEVWGVSDNEQIPEPLGELAKKWIMREGRREKELVDED